MASFFAVKEEVRRPQLRPPSPTIHAWEVDAAEYVFEYAPFGPGWFVLRCPRGVYLPAVSFEVHPLGERGQGQGLGLAHFNDRACKYHKHTTYTEEEMMVAYARRVVDAGGDDVTAQWAAESNEHLAETVMRRADKLAKRRQRCKVKVESDVLTAREEALLERIPISTDNAGKAYKAKVRTGSEKKHAAVSGKQRDNGSKPVCGSDDDDSFEDFSYGSNGMSSDSSEEEWV